MYFFLDCGSLQLSFWQAISLAPKIMKTFILLTALTVGVLASIYAWSNRSSDRVVTTFFTAVFLGSIGFFAKEVLSNEVVERKEQVNVVVFYGLDLQPLDLKLPYLTELTFYVQSVDAGGTTSAGGFVDIKRGQSLYFEAVCYAVLCRCLGPYSGGWDCQVRRDSGPSSESRVSSHGEKTDLVYSLKKLFGFFGHDPTLVNSQQAFRDEDYFQNYYFPPGTRISSTMNTASEKSVSFANRYVTIDIVIRVDRSSIDTGFYQQFLKDAPGTTANSMYRVEVSMRQNVFLNGHPEMERYRRWADQIADTLVNDFDYDRIHRRHREDLLLLGVRGVQAH